MSEEPGGQVEREPNRKPATIRTPRDIAEQLWEAWPFSGVQLPWQELTGAAAPIRVEEVRDGDQLVVRAEVPGVDPEKDIDVSIDDDVLTIRARREERHEDKQTDNYRSEFRYGSFERRLRLPRGTSGDVVNATYRDGVLEVRLPAPADTAPRRTIEVKRG